MAFQLLERDHPRGLRLAQTLGTGTEAVTGQFKPGGVGIGNEEHGASRLSVCTYSTSKKRELEARPALRGVSLIADTAAIAGHMNWRRPEPGNAVGAGT